MPLMFCDLNFIVTAHQGPEEYKRQLRELADAGTVRFVLSPMHWVEAAEDADPARANDKADFMDSIGALWLYERRGIQRKEAAFAFFRFLGIEGDRPIMMGSRSDVIANLAGVQAQRNSRDFVEHLRTVGSQHPLERSLQQAFESNQANGIRFRNGIISPDFLRRIERMYIQGLLPEQTPAGVLIDEDTKRRFLDACSLTDFPAFAVESLATYDNWRENRQLNRNNFMDQQHMTALPYVDIFLTDDARLRALIARISHDLPFPVAAPLTKQEFDARYS